MDESSIPSTAIYGGSLAHTFEYHTTGVHAMPHLHWSFPLQEGATISCPVLVAENVVYVGDSAGFLSALDARSGNLLWCFATDWALDGGKPVGADAFTGVTAFCLAGKLGYVASAHQTLYEVDLSNGQALRSWDNEALEISFGDITSLLFYDRFILFNDLNALMNPPPFSEDSFNALFSSSLKKVIICLNPELSIFVIPLLCILSLTYNKTINLSL